MDMSCICIYGRAPNGDIFAGWGRLKNTVITEILQFSIPEVQVLKKNKNKTFHYFGSERMTWTNADRGWTSRSLWQYSMCVFLISDNVCTRVPFIMWFPCNVRVDAAVSPTQAFPMGDVKVALTLIVSIQLIIVCYFVRIQLPWGWRCSAEKKRKKKKLWTGFTSSLSPCSFWSAWSGTTCVQGEQVRSGFLHHANGTVTSVTYMDLNAALFRKRKNRKRIRKQLHQGKMKESWKPFHVVHFTKSRGEATP